MRVKRIPAHERRKQQKRDEPKKIAREDERQLKTYLAFRTAVESEAVHDEYIREHLQQGFVAMSEANQAKLENQTENVDCLQRSLRDCHMRAVRRSYQLLPEVSDTGVSDTGVSVPENEFEKETENELSRDR